MLPPGIKQCEAPHCGRAAAFRPDGGQGRYCGVEHDDAWQNRQRVAKHRAKASEPASEFGVQPDGRIITPFGTFDSIFDAEAEAARLDCDDALAERDTCPADIALQLSARGKRWSWREWWLTDVCDESSELDPAEWFEAMFARNYKDNQ
jgi:hypothetical protein